MTVLGIALIVTIWNVAVGEWAQLFNRTILIFACLYHPIQKRILSYSLSLSIWADNPNEDQCSTTSHYELRRITSFER